MLLQHLYKEALRIHPDAIQFHFNHSLVGVDLNARQATFAGSDTNKKVTESYELLVGADGTRSQVRQQMLQQIPGMTVEREPCNWKYKGAKGLDRAGQPEGLPLIDEYGPCLFFTRSAAKTLDEAMTFGWWADNDGNVSGAFATRSDNVDHLQTADDFEAFIRKALPRFPELWVRPVAEQLAVCPTYGLGDTVKCNLLVGPSVALVGDAAHAVSANLGQGVNSGIESAGALAKALDDCSGDIQAGLQLYNQRRLPDVHALYKLDREAFDRRGYHGLRSFQAVAYEFHVRKAKLLHKLMPSKYPAEPVYIQMMAGRIPYSQALRSITMDDWMLATCVAAGVALLGTSMASITNLVAGMAA
jgi:2-polyprenyl-6-methoxyphenol hydroxylase-like FAD-dependent oxidoreductase